MYIKDVTFDESSMLKASSFQQLENKTNKTLQRVEFDVTSYVPVSSISVKISTLEETPIVEEEVELNVYLRLFAFSLFQN